MEQIESQDLANDHIVLISQIKMQLSQSLSEEELLTNEKIRETVLKLSEITTKSEFVSMMGALEDYKMGNFNVQEIDHNFTQHLKSQFDLRARSKSARKASNQTLPKCNCDLTCGDASSACTHSKCESTNSGCGFLWLFSCEDRDELFAQNCPS